MKENLLQSTLRELQKLISQPRLWTIFATVVVLFAVTGPFNTYERLPFATRLGYWLTNFAMSWTCALFCVVFFGILLRERIKHSLPRMLIGASVASLPIGFVITALNTAVMNVPFTSSQYLSNVLIALPVSLALCLIVWLTMSDGARESAASLDDGTRTQEPAERSTYQRPAILDRLPPEKRGALIRLEVQDHYVLAVTEKGREMLLMRLSDAVSDTSPAQGMKVHRSHWISRQGVKELIREPGKNGRNFIETTDGEQIPVSRTNVKEVRHWLQHG